jgi:hypothetical protein
LTKEKASAEAREKSRGRLQAAMLNESLERPREGQADKLESNRVSKLSKMGVTFGGDNGFYKVPQKMSSIAVESTPSDKDKSLRKQKVRNKTNRSPRAGENGATGGKNLEVIYENELNASKNQSSS